MPENLALASGGRLLTWSRISFITAVALFPLFIIPIPWFPFQLAKTALLSLLLAVTAVLYAVDAWHNRTLLVPRPLLAGAVLAYLAAVVVSWLFSQNQAASLIAEGTELDTVFFTVLLSSVFFFGMLLFKSVQTVRPLWMALLSAAAVVGLLSAIQLAFGPGTLGEDVFPAASSNVVGRWNDLAVFMAFAAVASMLAIDIARVRGKMLIGAIVPLVFALGLLCVTNLESGWWVTLAASLVGGAIAYWMRMSAETSTTLERRLRSVPIASVIVAILSAVFLVWGAAIASPINEALSIQELEVRPSAAATAEVMRVTYAQSTFTTLFGSGPNTFSEQWLLYKPADINLSAFWNIDFSMGSGAIPTMFITLGIVGGMLLLLIPVLLIVGLWQTVRMRDGNPDERMSASVVGVCALALFCLSFVYPVGQLPLVLAFALSGVYAGLRGSRRTATLSLFASPSTPLKIASIALLAAIVVVPIAVAAVGGQRFISSLYLGQALAAANASDLDRAEAYANRSLAVRETDDTLRFLANTEVARAQAALASREGTEASRAQAFQAAVTAAVGHARAAVAAAPRDYANWLALARIYEALIPAGVEGAYSSAQQTYVEAIRRNPRNPGLYLSAARMEGVAGAEQPLRDAVRQALTLKPNYTDAVLLIVQVEIAKNNLEGAIQASMAAVQTAPDNAGLWLQLGLLALNANAPADATIAFERALTLLPDYANAKYFLGLTYYQTGKTAEAAGLFTELAAQNPDNAEVALVLANMRAGRPAFEGATPPVQNPTKPTNPPVKEQ